MHPYNLSLVIPLGDALFLDAPPTVQQALARFMGESEALKTARVGWGVIPMEKAKERVFEEIEAGFSTFEAYHQWYMNRPSDTQRAAPRTERWPSIVSKDHYELFEDGWHRFHAYVAAGDLVVPVAWIV